MEKNVHDLRVPLEDSYRENESLDQHESYGMVSMSHCSCGGKGLQLFGSNMRHSNFISLQISRADRTRDMYGNHYYPTDTLVEIYLSPAQFTGMLTQMNTTGIPCTLHFTENEGIIENAPLHEVGKELFTDLEEKYNELARKLRSLQVGVENDLKGAVSKEAKERIRFNINSVYNDLNSNLNFLQKRQTERLEHVGTEIIAEAEATINSLIYEKGLEGLKREVKEIDLSCPTKEAVPRRLLLKKINKG